MNNLKNISAFYEGKIATIENDNAKLNIQWQESFEEDWLEKYDFKDIIDYRQKIMNKTCDNNNYLHQLKTNFRHTMNKCNFLYKIYWWIVKASELI